MSEEKPKVGKVELPVSYEFGKLSESPELTAVSVANKLITLGEHIALTTQHNLTIPFSQIEMLALSAEQHGFLVLAKYYRHLLFTLRVNSASEGGNIVKVAKDICVVDSEKSKREAETLGERLIGRGNK